MSDLSDEETEVGVLIAAKDAVFKPLRHVTSKPAQRVYIGTLLTFLASAFLLGVAFIAYLLFYYSYIPDRGFSVPIYLQFSPGYSPHGSATIPKSLVAYQKYDAKVVLHMPQSRPNREAGNFMVNLRLLAPSGAGTILNLVEGDNSGILAESSRPAILTYHSIIMQYVHRATILPLHVVGWRQEAETLAVPMLEGIEFSKGSRNIPDRVRLELHSEKKLQIYTANIELTARLRGLRYVMYNWKLTSMIVLTSLFWTVEMLFAAAVWLVLSLYFSSPAEGKSSQPESNTVVKKEPAIKNEDEVSDTPHNFPTLTGQAPLRYTSPGIKKEQGEDPPVEAPPAYEEADDEDDEDANMTREGYGGRDDSGIGTSMDSSAGMPNSVRRRKSKIQVD